MAECVYFAYGSNMNLAQMAFRCPNAKVVGNACLEDYRLAFCGRRTDAGVATILPEKGSRVNGVLWKITGECEKSLDWYEGYPNLYGKEMIHVKDAKGVSFDTMAYVMNAPYKDQMEGPSKYYLRGILEGCRQNGIPQKPVLAAVKRTLREKDKKEPAKKCRMDDKSR